MNNLCRDINSNNNIEGLLINKRDFKNRWIVMIRGKMIITIIKTSIHNNNPNSSLHSSTNTTKY